MATLVLPRFVTTGRILAMPTTRAYNSNLRRWEDEGGAPWTHRMGKNRRGWQVEIMDRANQHLLTVKFSEATGPELPPHSNEG